MNKVIWILSLLLISKTGFSQGENYKQMRLFNKLWKKIDENYASFELKGINWKESYNWIKPKITRDLTQEQLMDTLSLMLKPFEDGHVGISMITLFPLDAPRDFIAERQSQFYAEFSSDDLRNELFELTNRTLLDYGFQKLSNGYQKDKSIIDFTKSSSIGYMHISHMERISRRKVKNRMRYIISELSNTKGLIIDVRDNRGGLDNISDLINNL
jgi:carboxyl-terminal processing protease